MKIFDRPEFKLSPNGHNLKRLSFRYHGIIQDNLQYIKDCSIIDLGFHDGRWSYAASLEGAKHIQGIEVNDLCLNSGVDKLIKNNGTTLKIINDDIMNVIDDIEPADTLMCLGFLYHTFDFVEILRRLGKKVNVLILDTMVHKGEGNAIAVRKEGRKQKLLTNPNIDYNLVPTVSALEIVLEHCGFRDIKHFDYSGLDIEQKDYAGKRRITLKAFRN